MKINANRYEIGESIGSGAMGDVYLAIDTQTGATVAVKHLKPSLLDHDPHLLKRFQREGRALRDLNHPNIVTMLDGVEQDGNHYLIMEYVDGGDLKDLLVNSPNGLPIDQVLQIAIQLADALTRSHFLDIIHRDIKPANVLIEGDDIPRLTDFGLAHFEGEAGLTQAGAVVGTVAYLSPETCMGKKVDARSDIWSFGVMLFELLSGQCPFSGDTIGTIVTSILGDTPPDVQEIRVDTPDDLNDLIYRMLEKNREARIPSVRLVGAELEAIIKDIDITPLSAMIKTSEQDELVELQSHSVFSTPAPLAGEVQHNLPAQTTHFVGREEELEDLGRMISDPSIRLVTLMAPGGMGKTRLAIETGLAHMSNFKHGALFVGLDKFDDPAKIPGAIAEAANYKFHADGDPKEQILAYLSNKNLLLILDNYEHIIAGAGLVAEFMQAAPGLSVIATSREKLNIGGENLLVIGGMKFPKWETPEDALRYSAVQLFMQSATRTRIDFEITDDNLSYVARVCSLVQGVPLGILLAAAWVDTLTVEEIAAEIQGSVDFLDSEQRDLPERQRSMRAVFDYSWRLLNDAERDGLARMSVFRGGCTRKAAQSVSQSSTRMLTGLVNKSLLRRDQETGRFEIHELIRQFAEEALDQLGDVGSIRDKHARYYLEGLSAREVDLKGSDQIQAVNDVEVDFENIRSSWAWAIERDQNQLLLQALQSANIYCLIRNRALAGTELFGSLVEKAQPGSALQARAVAFHETNMRGMEKRPNAIKAITAAFTTLDDAGDTAGKAMALYALGYALVDISEYEEAITTLERALAIFEELGDLYNQAFTLHRLGYVYSVLNDLETAINIDFRCLEINQRLGNLFGIIWINNNIATTLEQTGQGEEALAYLEENNQIGRKLNDKQSIAWSGVSLAINLVALDQRERGQQYLDEALAIIDDINHTDTSGWVLYVQMVYSSFDEDYEQIKATLERLEALPLTRQDMLSGIPLHHFFAEAGMGDMEAARRYLPRMVKQVAAPWPKAMLLYNLALMLEFDGQPEKGLELLHVAFSIPTTSDWMTKIPISTSLQDRLSAALPADVHAAAIERGKALDIDAAIQQIKDEGLI